ncbi:MAG: SusC/RagA family TonB-linked outer membrane protein [Gemmatimonadaceae bacterium]
MRLPRWKPALLLAGLFAVATAEAEAQGATITGRVATDVGQSIEGANVVITEMGISVTTNAQGQYSIIIPEARAKGQSVVIVARSIGRTPQRKTIQAAGTQTVDFVLTSDPIRLADVVVTGVATGTERAKLPFDVAKVDASDLPAPSGNPLSQLQGRVPGANIVSTTGRPGQAPQVLLRAPTSIDGSGRGQQPLYVVDGVILAGDLPDLNASDVESIEVVKGAAATSLYGARAGNGVIQITTKRGGAGVGDNQLRFGVRSEYGVSNIEHEFPLAQNHLYRMDPTGTRFCGNAACTTTFNWVEEVLRLNSVSSALPAAPAFSPVYTGTSVWNRFQTGKWPGQTFNAIDQVVEPGNFGQLDGHMTGRFNQTNFFASLGVLNQEGSFVGLNGFQRGSARVNIDQRIGSDWNVQLSTYYSRSKDDGAGQEGNSFFDLTRMPRVVDLFMKDSVRGDVIIRPDLAAENENPVYSLLNIDRQDQKDRFIGGLNSVYQPVSWFDLRAELSYDRRNNRFSEFRDKGFRTVRSSSTNLGQVFKAENVEQSMNTALTGAVHRTFLNDFNTNLSLRLAYEQQDFGNANATGRDLAVKGVPDLDNARSPQIFVTSGESAVKRIGGFLNGTVDYKDRYYVDALLRRDGSSLFGRDNRWQTFGRVGASWLPSRESWFNVPGIDELKLRYAMGTAGNSPDFEAQYEVYQLDGGNFTPLTAGNRNLGPELLTEHEAGVDAKLFDRLGVTVSHSRVTTKDQILLVPLPASAGFQFQWQNAGTMKGNTWEASLEMPWIRKADFDFTTRLTWDRSRATITELSVPPFQYGVNSQALEVAFFAREGERYGTIYGTKWATSCGELQAGTDCSQFRKNSDGYMVWTAGADPGSGASRDPATGNVVVAANTWGTAGPTVNGRTAMWGMPLPAQDATGNRYLPLGNTLPDYRWAVSPNMRYKRFTATALVDASQGRVVYNQGRHWAYFENYSADQDQEGKPDHLLKPVGYYGSTPGLYDVLQPNSHFVEDGSFVKLREMTVSYHIGRLGSGDWTASLIGRNLKTFTDYTGFDPEVGVNGGDSGSGVVNAFDAFRFPNLRTFTLGLSASF